MNRFVHSFALLLIGLLLGLVLAFGASYVMVVSQNPGPQSANTAVLYGPVSP